MAEELWSDQGLSVDVAICAYTLKRWKDLVAAIESVLAQSVKPARVLVCIDYNPELQDLAEKEFGTLEVEVFANSHRKGLSGARNTCMERSTAAVLAFLDDDARAGSSWLEELIAPYADPDVAGVGGAIRPAYDLSRPEWIPDELLWVVGCSYRGQRVGDVRNLIGANMSFRRSVLIAAGGFSESLGRTGGPPVGCGETEACIRVRGLKEGPNRLLSIANAEVTHRVPSERTSVRYFVRRSWLEGASKAEVVRRCGLRSIGTEITYLSRLRMAESNKHAVRGGSVGRQAVLMLCVAATSCRFAVSLVANVTTGTFGTSGARR